MKPVIIFLTIMFSTLFLMAATDTKSLWVTASKAKLKSDKTASSDTVAELDTGLELKVISSEKKWFEVKAGEDKKGWIYRGKVSKNPPDELDDLGGGDDLLEDPGLSGVILAAADTARSIRGKKTGGGEAANFPKDEYWKALNHVLTFYAGDDEIQQFLKQGKIGEYAE